PQTLPERDKPNSTGSGRNANLLKPIGGAATQLVPCAFLHVPGASSKQQSMNVIGRAEVATYPAGVASENPELLCNTISILVRAAPSMKATLPRSRPVTLEMFVMH